MKDVQANQAGQSGVHIGETEFGCLEVSGLPPQNLLKYLPQLQRYGHKVIFGSDWPGVPGIRANMEAIRKIGLRDEITNGILGGTAAKLLGLKLEG